MVVSLNSRLESNKEEKKKGGTVIMALGFWRERERRERDTRIHSPFALHAAIFGGVIKADQGVPFASRLRQKSRVERLKTKVEPL